ncbi:MAG: hypothetical protein LBV57_07315, partial [Candidatus Symbiothrix sp.]|nr:hypothetical protein [Candidatus Symbiothrix sp.]
ILPDARDLHLQTIKGKKERELHQFLMQFPDSVYSIESMLGTSPMWDKSLPLKQYLFYRIQQQNSSYPLCFAKVGVTFESYAKQIALRYPFQYVKRYIVPSFCSVFLYQYQDITDWNNPFQSEKFTEDYFEITPVTHEHPATIFPFVNSLRHVFHSVYWIAGVLCTLFFAFNIKKYSKEREKFFLLLTLIGFIVIYIGGSVVASPNTTWRYSMPFYAPSLAFMLVILRDALQYITKSLTTSTKTI